MEGNEILFVSILAVIVLGSALVGFLVLVRDEPGEEKTEDSAAENNSTSPVIPNYEIRGVITIVGDGDTVEVWIDGIISELDPRGEVYNNTYEWVRFGGGIDAPEMSEEGGAESEEYINSLCPPGTIIYLDLDDWAVGGDTSRPYRGRYERLVAVIYINVDGQWVNVNAELLRWGMENYPGNDWDEYAAMESEFNIYDWPPYNDDYPFVLE